MSGHLVTRPLAVLLCLAAVYIPPACAPTHHCPPGSDVFGPYTVPYGGKGYETLTKLRGFIWLQWHEHRPGCAEVTTTSMEEGVRCTSIYIVEPDKRGTWHIFHEWKCGPGTRGIPKATSGRSTFYSVQRIRQDSPGRERSEELPDSADVPASTYLLDLMDISGQKKGGI